MDPYAGGRGSQLGMDEGKVTKFILTLTLSGVAILTTLLIPNLLVFSLNLAEEHK